MTPEHLDVVIVGAGLSGIGAAYHVQTHCPAKSYAVLEGRQAIGGTWDLFRYPGVRSDSDMYTLGYAFRPWHSPKALADGPSILQYVRDTAVVYGIDRKIRFGHRVTRARWSTADARWTVEGDGFVLTCSFLYLCVGYYDYAEGYTPELAGRERFRGRIVHPQFWTSDVEYAGRRVVVIGSGATAVTLVPELAKRAAHVTMLQRSPTYIVTVPASDPIAAFLHGKLPPRAVYQLTRWKNVLLGMATYNLSRRYPRGMGRFLVRQVEKQLGGTADVATHFTPSYGPWDQRLCLVPDADLFHAIRDGRATVVTDHIAAFTERGLALRSGATLDADLVVTATGLKLQLFGGIALDVDGTRIAPSEHLVYKGMMCSDVPNLAFATGYTNASWTLKAELTSRYVCRLLAHMDRRGYTICRPQRPDAMPELPLIDFSSGYVQRALADLPRQGAERPWRLYQNYALDLVTLGYLGVEDRAMSFG